MHSLDDLNEHAFTDAVALEKTGHDFAHWNALLREFHAQDKPALEVVGFLKQVHHLDDESAKALATKFLKQKLGSWKASP